MAYFNLSLISLNSKFSFSSTSHYTKAEETRLHLLSTQSKRENSWMYTKESRVIWNVNSFAQNCNVTQ